MPSWSCPSCTFLNHESISVCEVCETAMPWRDSDEAAQRMLLERGSFSRADEQMARDLDAAAPAYATRKARAPLYEGVSARKRTAKPAANTNASGAKAESLLDDVPDEVLEIVLGAAPSLTALANAARVCVQWARCVPVALRIYATRKRQRASSSNAFDLILLSAMVACDSWWSAVLASPRPRMAEILDHASPHLPRAVIGRWLSCSDWRLRLSGVRSIAFYLHERAASDVGRLEMSERWTGVVEAEYGVRIEELMNSDPHDDVRSAARRLRQGDDPRMSPVEAAALVVLRLKERALDAIRSSDASLSRVQGYIDEAQARGAIFSEEDLAVWRSKA